MKSEIAQIVNSRIHTKVPFDELPMETRAGYASDIIWLNKVLLEKRKCTPSDVKLFNEQIKKLEAFVSFAKVSGNAADREKVDREISASEMMHRPRVPEGDE